MRLNAPISEVGESEQEGDKEQYQQGWNQSYYAPFNNITSVEGVTLEEGVVVVRVVVVEVGRCAWWHVLKLPLVAQGVVFAAFEMRPVADMTLWGVGACLFLFVCVFVYINRLSLADFFRLFLRHIFVVVIVHFSKSFKLILEVNM